MPVPVHSADNSDFANTQSWGGTPPDDAGTGAYSDGTTRTPQPARSADEAPTATSSDAPCDGSLPAVPGFEVLRSVGRGGMGSVFEAIQLGTRRRVALKILLTGWPIDPRSIARFAREAEILAAIEHPNIVNVYQTGSWHGQQYIVMKFVSGGTLAQYLPTLRRDLRAACRLFAVVARAVGHLHSRGYVHRDLKPSNVLIAEDGTPVVADLGLARSATSEPAHAITQHPAPLGTRPYMSPEQTRGGADSFPPACDIWAVGVMLYELLADERPFASDEPSELFRQIRNDPTPRIAPKLGAPPGLEAIARRCLEKAPDARYLTAEALAADLEAWAAGKPLAQLAAPALAVESHEPVKKHEPRRRSVTALATVLFVAASALFALSGSDPNPRPTLEQAPMPHPAPSLVQRVERWEEIELIGPNGELRVPAIPALPGSAVARGRDGYPVLTGRSTSVALFQMEEFPFPVELVGDIAVSEGKPGFGVAGFAVGTQTVVLNGEPHFVLWGFGSRTDHDRFIGDEIEQSESGYGILRFVRIADKSCSDKNFTCPATATLRHKADRPAPMMWNTIRVRVCPTELSATFQGSAIGPARIDAAKNISAFLTATGLPSELRAPVGPGIGVFANEADALYRNVRVRRLP